MTSPLARLPILLAFALALASCDAGRRSETPSASPADAEVAEDPGRTTDAGLYRVELSPETSPAPLNRIHNWVVRVRTPEGTPVDPKRIAIGGGMPQHGHGFVTEPRVTSALGDGAYRIEGVKFHMPGEWTFRVEIVGDSGPDVATFTTTVGP